MRKVLILTAIFMLGAGTTTAATRDANSTSRAPATTSNTAPVSGRGGATNTSRAAASTTRTAPMTPNTRATTTRGAATTSRSATTARTPRVTSRNVTTTRAATPRITRAAATIAARAATSMSETRTGAEYEICKTAYFTCMDQFCSLKNDDYRRCSCNNRVTDLSAKRAVLQEAGQQLTVFTENLDVVGMTAAQATAMRTASEGEDALTSDKSASKALLQAIMNSISGGDSNVGGKYSDLNSISISFDTANAFGMSDSGQLIASYNGQNLYNAVYPQCRDAVRADCNDASLQRAITAYLMAIEQDCNTVQTAIETTQSQMKAAVREGGAMLDLARVENRQNHNSSDLATCIAEIETAILSEEVCGAGYHKCLDNGEFIDVSTGAPITGVVKFYELEQLLTFSDGVAINDQKLAKIPRNQSFVKNFENRTKKFAAPALDKCVEIADIAWTEYLDKAILDIYYAQRSKVAEIKQGCFDFVSTCYMNGDAAITGAMSELIGGPDIILQPDKIALNAQLCRDYVESCNNMFDGNIIAQYIETRRDTDTLTACRAVAQQCFEKYGGVKFENFYYPYSGLFKSGTGEAPVWLSLYERNSAGEVVALASPCAQQLSEIDACNSTEMLEKAFGGLDYFPNASVDIADGTFVATFYTQHDPSYPRRAQRHVYGMLNEDDKGRINARDLRPTGVATEVYNQIIDVLSTQCININGRFVELQFTKHYMYDINDMTNGICTVQPKDGMPDDLSEMIKHYRITTNEDMCPRDYRLNVDVQSWGACLCFENGGRRSKWGLSATCLPLLPTAEKTTTLDQSCIDPDLELNDSAPDAFYKWCTTTPSAKNQICPPDRADPDDKCNVNGMPDGIL